MPIQSVWPRRHYADGPFGQIHFQTIGTGRPLVLLHQAPATSGQFDNVYHLLADRGFQAIGIDMPGFGMSDPTAFVPAVADYAKIVPPVLDALGLCSAALLGHHTGALVAVDAALQFGARIEALIVNGPLLVSKEDQQRFLDGLHVWEKDYKAQPHAAHMVELFQIRERLSNGTIPPHRLSDYVVQALMGRGVFWYGHHAAYMADQNKQFLQIEQPTLILTNTGDIIYPHALRARDLRPDFAFIELEGGGVDIVDQQPDAWADAVAAFLHSQPVVSSEDSRNA